jgi:anti-sigma B factor antagonist
MGELLTVTEEQTADAHILSVRGEIDLSTASSLEQAVVTAVDQAAHAVVVLDLSGVDFLSSAGISALLKAKQYGDDRNTALRLVVPEGGVMRRSLQITGLLDILPIFPSRPDAMRGPAGS